MYTMLSHDIINTILPTQTLSTLQGGELENDVHIVLDWIKFAPPISEPSPRVKSAIRSILKDELNQNDFVVLLNNSINEFWKTINYDDYDDFEDILEILIQYTEFYDDLLKYLNLSYANETLFRRNINQIFTILYRSHKFQADVRLFFDKQFFTLPQIDFIRILKLFDKIFLINELIQILINITVTHIKNFITDNCQGWNKSVLLKINQWLKVQLFPNFKLILKFLNPTLDYFNDLLKIAYNELVSLRLSQIFHIVLNYPKSEVSLLELHTCLNYKALTATSTNLEFQRNKLVEDFLINCEKHSLNSGVNTTNLIKIYIRIIKSFLIIDPKGVLLDKVIRPIRKYLKTRDDIIQKLVMGLVDDTSNNPLFELNKELSKLGESLVRIKDDYDLNWVPDPIDALADFKKYKINDIIESLVSIFDNKEIFISEFTKLFGSKLIKINELNDQYIADNELSKVLKLIKLLKIRFGKNEFFNLDIMILDILNTKKLYANFKCLVISHLYWSDILEDPGEWKVHPQLIQQFHNYNEQFMEINYNRYLRLLPNFSKVKLRLNGQEMVVSVDKASIIYCFHEVPGLSMAKVCELLNMSEYMAKQGLNYWVDKDILVEISPGNYIVNE